MKLMTWNINSVRLRAPLLKQVTDMLQPDVVCLQETKTRDEFFPKSEIEDMGYAHMAFVGMKGYNGVAIISKYPLTDIQTYDRCDKEDCRHISAKVVKNNTTAFDLHNLYIPAGGYEPDLIGNEKFKHKLDFVDEMADWFPSNYSNDAPMIVVGDLNIAPMEHDVWDHKKMLKVVSHTPLEVEKFTIFQNKFGWVDALRHFVPQDEKLYTWWSYRAKDWAAADKGRRLDHMWVTPPLKSKLKSHRVFKEARGWGRPSDHAPVMIELDL